MSINSGVLLSEDFSGSFVSSGNVGVRLPDPEPHWPRLKHAQAKEGEGRTQAEQFLVRVGYGCDHDYRRPLLQKRELSQLGISGTNSMTAECTCSNHIQP